MSAPDTGIIASPRAMRRPRSPRNGQLALLVAALVLSAPAAAIPSPDLVINLSASVAQLLGLLSVVFGGVAMRRGGAKGKRRRAGEGTPRLFFLSALALLLVSLAANVLQYTRAIDARTDRLHTNLVRKSVENGKSVGDTSLKTLSFSEQLDHPQGVDTATLADWIDSDVPVNLIDVREQEEYEVGAISGTSHVRYPDLLASSSLLPDADAENARTVLLCYSGNRSSELCAALTEQGKSCSFMVGGYEKWMTEDRPVSTGEVGNDNNGELRKLADYPNKNVLLDTPDVHALVQQEGAEFIDVRYPEDFVGNHLPGAHNITMRALGTTSLDQKIDALPDTPLIGACYDKRSCFYSTVIGLRLTRAGKDYRGRYSVPHEYYIPKNSQRAHVAAWQAGQEQLTFMSFVIAPARQLVDFLVSRTGSALIGLLLLVGISRLLIGPLALKAERDTRVQKSLAHEISTIRSENDDHPRAAGQATMDLLQQHRVRPVAGLLNSLLQLGLTLLFYQAVEQSANGWSGPLFWIDSASTPDPYMILPIAATLMFALVIGLQVRPKTRRGRGLLVLGSVALFALLQALGGAVNLYLLISMSALVLQSLVFARIATHRRWDARGRQPLALGDEPIEDNGLVPLSQAHRLPGTAGRKAARLGHLIEAGFDVPPGFVITDSLAKRLAHGALEARAATTGHPEPVVLDADGQRDLDTLWNALGVKHVAVRSSGANEDGSDASFAGVYESILNVERDGLGEAARKVYASLDSQRSAVYSQRDGAPISDLDLPDDTGGVLVQAMIPAEYAGVLFTEHPTSSGSMLIEVVAGLGEDLVSGTVTPDTFRFGKLSGAQQGNEEVTPPIDFAPLMTLAREVEALFDAPQDIEWAYANGRFHLLQARDITRSVAAGDTLHARAERERARLLASLAGRRRTPRRRDGDAIDAPLLVQNELSELLPRPTPASADLMSRLWEANGATDIACQELGVPYDVHPRSVPFVTTLFGWTYVNRVEEARRIGSGPGALASFRLSRDADAMTEQFLDDFLPRFREQMVERNAIAMDALSIETATLLLEQWVERFVTDTYVQAERINIAAGFHMAAARDKLASASLDPARHLAADGDSIAARALALLAGDGVDRARIEEFLLVFGHRAPLDYELSTPRFDEDPALVSRYVTRSGHAPARAPHDDDSAARDAELGGRKVLVATVERARRFQNLKEDAKHYCLIELAQIRRLLLAIDRAAGLDGRVFQLSLTEAARLGDETARPALLKLADARAEDALAWHKLQPPVSLSLDALERMDLVTGEMPGEIEQGSLAGARVAGSDAITGVARVITSAEDIDTFEQGEILIARMTDPTWYPLFPRAAGIVTEIGGWLSHAAIVAREFDLPAIVGVEGACRAIATGDIVTLKLDGNIVIEQDRRDAPSAGTADVADAASLSDAQGNVHQLDDNRRFRFTSASERRAIKANFGDRRRVPRFDANGEPVADRRAIARAANLSVYREAS